MKDAEDIINSLTAYLTEVVGSKSRINNAIDASNADKGDSLVPNVTNDIVLAQRIKELQTFKTGWINIDITGEARNETQWDAVAATYEIEVSYVARDDMSPNMFLRALRMAGVISDVMSGFLREAQEAGFITGRVFSSFTPERVLLGNSSDKAIKSGVIYNLTTQ